VLSGEGRKPICDAGQCLINENLNERLCIHMFVLVLYISCLCCLFVMQEIHGLLRLGVAAVKISTQFSPWTSALFNFFLHSQTGLNS
ncbi:unnamed protein product, partial [Brassica oleracea var. botrytis]